MNDERRRRAKSVATELATLLGQLDAAAVRTLALSGEEHAAYENLPENLQEGDQGTTLNDNNNKLANAYMRLGEASASVAQAYQLLQGLK